MHYRFLGIVAAVAAATAAQATMTYLGSHAGAGLTVNYNGNNMNVFAGKLKFKDNTTNANFMSVCADLDNVISNGQTWTFGTALTSTLGTNKKAAGHILATNWFGATTNDQCLALQVAVWEAVYDFNGTNTANFGGGIFKATLNAGQLALANGYYAAATGSGDAIYFGPLPSNAGQGQMTVVPEPATLGALGVGLAAMLRKRKKA